MELTIVIVNWNTRDILEECLESVYRFTEGLSFEVFVVDNASGDGSTEMVADKFPQAHLIANHENLGYSRANNQAIRLAKGAYVALLNPDTRLVEPVFPSLIQECERDERIGAIGPRIVSEDGVTVQDVCARRLPTLYYHFCKLSGLGRVFPNSKLFGGELMSYWDHDNSCPVGSLSGACMMVRQEALDTVGLLDENQFMYGDDTDWCRRFHVQGWKVYYFADKKLIHYGGKSSEQAVVKTAMESAKATRYYFLKHHGPFYAWASCVLTLVFSSVKYAWRHLPPQTERKRFLAQLDKTLALWGLRQTVGQSSDSRRPS